MKKKFDETSLNVSIIQQSFSDDLADNRKRIDLAIEQAANQGAQLILLSELHNTPYFCQTENVDNFDLAETIPGESTAHFSALAKKHQAVIVTSIFEKRAAGLYHNTAVVIEADGSIAGSYRKMHIPDDPGFYEKFYFTPGDQGFMPISTSLGNLGILICWDQWFPEAARLMALAGADLLLYPTAIGWNPSDDGAEKTRQKDAWVTVQRGHAIANGLPVIVANRHGHEQDPSLVTEGIDFWGNSFICGAQGEMLAQSQQSDSILTAKIDLSRTETTRRIWPFLRDRRTDAYYDIIRQYID